LRVTKLVSHSAGCSEALGSLFGSDQQYKRVSAREAALKKQPLEFSEEVKLLFGGWGALLRGASA